MLIREATGTDVPRLVELRMKLFAEVGMIDPAEQASDLREATRDFLDQATASGGMRTWVAEDGGRIVSTGSLIGFVRPPYPGNLTGREVYVLNMYTEASHRRRGLARLVLEAILAEVRAQGIGKVCLHASPNGEALYRSLGFVPTPTAMEWTPT